MQWIRKTDTPLSEQEVADWMRQLRAHAHVPFSGYAVASVFKVQAHGATYYVGGVNVENRDHRLSTHGEEGALSAMVTALGPQARITEGWVMGAPASLRDAGNDSMGDIAGSCCGKCRQQIAAFAEDDVVIHGLSLNGTQRNDHTVNALLPDKFTERAFAHGEAAQESGRQAPAEAEVMGRAIRHCAPDKALSKEEIRDWLKGLEAVDRFSKTSQVVVVRLENGDYVAGTQIEDAAFISINAVQSAMGLAVAAYGEPRVKEVFCYGKGRDGHELKPNCVLPLPLSAVQTLGEFTDNPRITVRYMDEQGRFTDTKLEDAVKLMPSSGRNAVVPVVGRGVN